jgi:hypothetical protein
MRHFCVTSKARSDITIGPLTGRLVLVCSRSEHLLNQQSVDAAFLRPLRPTELKLPPILEETFASAAL